MKVHVLLGGYLHPHELCCHNLNPWHQITTNHQGKIICKAKSDDIEFITGLKTQYAQKSAYIKKFHRQEPITLHLILSTLTHWLQRLMIKKGNP